MMQVVPKWKISIKQENAADLVLYISDNFLSNVLRKLSDISFAHDPTRVVIELQP